MDLPTEEKPGGLELDHEMEDVNAESKDEIKSEVKLTYKSFKYVIQSYSLY
jgi:hypothetical protein